MKNMIIKFAFAAIICAFAIISAQAQMDKEDITINFSHIGEGDSGDRQKIAFNKFESLKSEKAFLSYLCTISIRILANNAKKKKPENFNGKEEMNFNIQDVNAQTDSDTDVYYLYKALALLPDIQKEAIILFELTGFNIKEIMEFQEASESSIKHRLKV